MAYSLDFMSKNTLHAVPGTTRDIYVVEYPKSGITWFNTMLANLALLSSGRDDIKVTFANVRQIIPSIHVGQHVAEPVYSSPPFRFMKSHSVFNINYTFSVYIVRNPINVAKSYYRYLHWLGHIDMDFSSYIRNKRVGIQTWANHVSGWLDSPMRERFLHLVHYEKMEQDAALVLSQLCENIGWEADPEHIKLAVERSQADVMKKQEAFYGQFDPRYEPGFVKSKTSVIISEEDEAYIRSVCTKEMKLLGYD